MERICPNCGANIKEGQKFCAACGKTISYGQQQATGFYGSNERNGYQNYSQNNQSANVASDNVTASSYNYSDVKSKEKSNNSLIIICITVVVALAIIVGGVCAYLYMTNDNDDSSSKSKKTTEQTSSDEADYPQSDDYTEETEKISVDDSDYDYKTSGNDPDLENWFSVNKYEMESSFMSSFESTGGMSGESDLELIDNKFVFSVRVTGVDNVDYETRQEVQKSYDDMEAGLTTTYQQVKESDDALAALEGVILYLCEEDGDLIADIDLELE